MGYPLSHFQGNNDQGVPHLFTELGDLELSIPAPYRLIQPMTEPPLRNAKIFYALLGLTSSTIFLNSFSFRGRFKS